MDNDTIDNIYLSLEKLDSLLFFLEAHLEEECAHSVKYPKHSIFEPRSLSLLYMANEIQREIKADIDKLGGKDEQY